MGIEFTGLADMWAMLGLEYGSSIACETIDSILHTKAVTEIQTSIEIAKKKGHADCFKTKKSRKEYISQPYIQRILDKLLTNRKKQIESDVLEHGLRNSAFNTVGPTGTISIVAGNCSSGIEPVFRLKYKRRTRLGFKSNIFHYPLLIHGGPQVLDLTDTQIKSLFNYKESQEINFRERLKVQSIIQNWTDSSVSSTINLPEDSTIEDIYKIYLEGFHHGLKGITVFRNGSKDGVLVTGKEKKKDTEFHVKNVKDIVSDNLKHLKDKLKTTTLRAYRFIGYWKGLKVYIIVGVDSTGNPIEVFSELPPEAGLDKQGNFNPEIFTEYKSYWDSICRLISLNLRAGVALEDINKQLEKCSYSMVALPGILHRQLSTFMHVDNEQREKIKNREEEGEYCMECHEKGIIYESGCKKCLFCGDSKCS